MKLICFFVFIIVSVGGIHSKPTEKKAATSYENPLYGFTIDKPKDWSTANADELAHLIQMASSAITAHQEKFSHILSNWSIESITPLFCFSKYALNAASGQLNPNILSLAEDLNVYRNVKSPCDYFNVSREIIQSLPLKVNFIGTCADAKINGVNFKKQIIHSRFPGFPLIKQTFYAKTVKNNRLLIFLLTHFNRNSQAQLERIIRSLKFANNQS